MRTTFILMRRLAHSRSLKALLSGLGKAQYYKLFVHIKKQNSCGSQCYHLPYESGRLVYCIQQVHAKCVRRGLLLVEMSFFTAPVLRHGFIPMFDKK